MSNSNHTKLSVKNDTDESVAVFVTFAAANPGNACCPSPATVEDFGFLTKIHPLMGTFELGANETQEFDSKGKCFSGNICFYIEPQCPVAGADFHHGEFGTSIFEFTFNPNQGCDEAFDISMVNGINSFMKVQVAEDLDLSQGWSYGPDNTPINKIYNKGLQLNQGNPGVFPVNCTTCTGHENAPCPTLPIGPAQKEAICNIQRTQRGGTVKLMLVTPTPQI